MDSQIRQSVSRARRRGQLPRLVWRQLRARRGRALVLGAGLLVACTSFSLLTSAVNTTEATVQGAVRDSFRTSYDLLVRPRGAQTALERSGGVVPNNLETGIYGGITKAQWRTILDLPGVEVAAPVQYIGYVMPFVRVYIPLGNRVGIEPGSLYRVDYTSVAQRGLSRYPGSRDFVFLAGDRRDCNIAALFPPEPDNPWSKTGRTESSLWCVTPGRSGGIDPADLRIEGYAQIPMLIAAIDPVQENALLALDKAVVEGSALAPGLHASGNQLGSITPVIASTTTFSDSNLEVRLAEVQVPAGEDPARHLREPRLNQSVETLGPNAAYRWARRLPTQPVGRFTIQAQSLYERLLDQLALPSDARGSVFTGYWSASSVRYEPAGAGVLRPVPLRNDDAVWLDPVGLGGLYNLVPVDNRDVQFRKLAGYTLTPNKYGGGRAELSLGGTFDPSRLPGFNPLNRVPLETYFPPTLEPADAASRAALGDQPLAPDANIGGYVAQPPALLTTLRAAKGLTAPRFFQDTNFEAPISVIRVRVGGVSGPDEISLNRIELVAKLITERTGLTVDVTAGSSPQPQTIQLPAGEFGRPELLVEEGWAKKGVSLVILAALDRKSLALFALVLVVTAGFVGNAALASVRARRTEIGALLCLGWQPRHIFAMVLGELALIGAVAGLTGAAVAAGIIAISGLHMPLVQILLVPPLAVVLALAAGAAAAATAARGQPIDAVAQALAGRTGSRSTRRFSLLAWSNLRRRPGRALVAASGLILGVAALTVLVAINLAFAGSVSGTLLGDFVAVEARTVDYVSVALAIALAGVSLADVLALGIRERSAELAALQASGWSERHVVRLTLTEATIIGTSSCLLGALIGLAIGIALGGQTAPVLSSTALATVVGLAVTAAATAIPVTLILRTPLATLLAEE